MTFNLILWLLYVNNCEVIKTTQLLNDFDKYKKDNNSNDIDNKLMFLINLKPWTLLWDPKG